MSPGNHLGPYEIVSQLGSGGMGEVWRARDSRLGRDVAIKTLPPRRGDAAQFEQEARAVAALNHPNIVSIYDVGMHEGTPYIVVELVEGESLRDLMARENPIALRKVVDIAGQIADGLAAAHETGFAHRDLKPDNIMITREGRPKILDFGLAKSTAPASESDITQTIEGVVKGTPGYLSPEQARGAKIDHRSDIFSFGAVLYEMLAGRRAFNGGTVTEMLAEVIKTDPPELPDSIPPSLRDTVRHCLEKDPVNRYQSAKDLAFSLRSATTVATSPGEMHAVAAHPAIPKVKQTLRHWLPYALPAVALIAGLLLGPVISPRGPDPLSRLRFIPFATASDTEMYPRFSPDGASVAYIQYDHSVGQVFVRSMDDPAPQQLTQADDRALFPFWRPDGNRIFYTSGDSLWTVSVAGGAPERVLSYPGDSANASAAIAPNGNDLIVARLGQGSYELMLSSPPGAGLKATGIDIPATTPFRLQEFSPDGSTIVGFTMQESSLWVIPYPGGKPRRIELDGYPYSAAWFPDSRHVAATVTSAAGGWRIVIVDTQSSARATILSGAEDIFSASVAPDGRRIVYSTGISDLDAYLFSADGKSSSPITATTRLEMEPAFSPTGDRVAYHSESELWLRTLDGKAPVRLARQDPGDSGSIFNSQPRFSPDGGRIAYLYGKDVRIIPSDGGRAAILTSEASGRPSEGLAWAPDGSAIAFTVSPIGRIVKVNTDSKMASSEIVPNGASGSLDWSPDGSTIAYLAEDGIRAVAVSGSTSELKIPGSFRTIRFDRSGQLLYALRLQNRQQGISVYDWATGRELRSIDFEVNPSLAITTFDIDPATHRIAVTMGQLKYDLWILAGFPQPATGILRWWSPWTDPIPPPLRGKKK